MITITVEDIKGTRQQIEIPEDENLSLMEALKKAGYNILAACGGIALCATCHVQVLSGLEKLAPPGEAELIMLDTLPNAAFNSRLSCQVKAVKQLQGSLIRISE